MERVFEGIKPGGHTAFGGTRTYHRMACAIEDAGFEIGDQMQCYMVVDPQSHDIVKRLTRSWGLMLRGNCFLQRTTDKCNWNSNYV